MNIQTINSRTEEHPFNHELTLWNQPQSFLVFPVMRLSLLQQDNQPLACRLTFKINPQTYQHLETKALFNLTPEVRTPLSSGEFLPEPDIAIEVTLKPDLLPLLAEQGSAIDQIATSLLTLNQSQPDHPLFSTENWLACSVKQQQPTGEIGYRTLWSYVSPAALTQTAAGSSHEISAGIVNFFKDWAETNLTNTTQIAANQASESIAEFLEQLTNLDLDELLDRLPDDLSEPPPVSTTLLETVIHFFTTDHWTFTKLQGQPVLQMGCQGENGSWICYAHARDTQQQFIFYSVYPTPAPEDKRSAIAEFLTRANYGMTIGNFELDFSDGEIRYKTSIDVEGDRLTPALIKRLVYTNVMMMDEYLPGIKAVIETGVSPEEAIRSIEQPDSETSSEQDDRLSPLQPQT